MELSAISSISLGNRVRHYINPLHVYCRIYRIVGKRLGKLIALTVYGKVYDKIEELNRRI